jgi:hypothetical protein
MKQYLRDREKEYKASAVTGIVLTVSVHLLACLLCGFTGMKYLYPPPQEQTFLIDFEEEEQPVVRRQRTGRNPQAEQVDKTKPVELIQQSKSPHKSEKTNKTAEGKPDSFGDVETPVQKEEIDKNALFPGMSKKDSSLAPHGALKPEAEYKAGHPQGNTATGRQKVPQTPMSRDATYSVHYLGRPTLSRMRERLWWTSGWTTTEMSQRLFQVQWEQP